MPQFWAQMTYRLLVVAEDQMEADNILFDFQKAVQAYNRPVAEAMLASGQIVIASGVTALLPEDMDFPSRQVYEQNLQPRPPTT